jgi:hypothetical protein
MTTSKDLDFVSLERIAQSILVLRERRVLLDSNLAAMYGVPTKRFNEQVKRNFSRIFEVAICDLEEIRSRPASQVPALRLHGARCHHGSMILSSPRAVEVSVYVVRAFVQLRGALAAETEIARRVTKLEQFVTLKHPV